MLVTSTTVLTNRLVIKAPLCLLSTQDNIPSFLVPWAIISDTHSPTQDQEKWQNQYYEWVTGH